VSREQLLSGGRGLLLTVGGCPPSLRPHGSVHLPLLVVGVAGAAGRGQVHSPLTLHLTPPETHVRKSSFPANSHPSSCSLFLFFAI
jgi:hypothetical protein